MSSDDETRGGEPLKLDQQSLEAIIKGVAAKLKKDCTHGKQGKHSGSVTASGSSKNSGELLVSPNSARCISPLHLHGCEIFHYWEIYKPVAEWETSGKPDQARLSMARHNMAWHGMVYI